MADDIKILPNVLTSLVERQRAKYGQRAALWTRRGPNDWVAHSWEEVSEKSALAARALVLLGIKEEDRVAIFSPNDAKILLTDFACFANRAVPVSIYATSSREQVEYIVRDSEAALLCVGTEAQYRTAREATRNLPHLQRIIAFDDDFAFDADDTTSLSFESLLELGRRAGEEVASEVGRRRAAAKPEDIATLLYTSGTTGEPKGAILPHSCFDAQLAFHHRRLTTCSDRDISLNFLPLSHIFEKAWTYLALDFGMQVYVNRDPHIILDAVREVHPTCMCSVPRFWEKAYAAINDKMGRMRLLSRLLSRHALNVGRIRNLEFVRRGIRVPRWLQMRYYFYYRRVFRKVQRIMGVDRGNIFPTAGAPLSDEIVTFFHSMGVNVMIGYGLSETTATVSCFPQYNYVIGSVGTPMEGIDVKIGADDEILVKGPTVMRGYYHKPKETAEAFTADGWLRTGDAGRFVEHGALVLTERIKDLFKTSNGKYIAPQAIEALLGKDKYIEQAAVIGDRRKYVSALIVPVRSAVEHWAHRQKIPFASYAALLKNPAVHSMMADRLEELTAALAPYEHIKRFTLLPEEFTMENGELTNTLKLRRPVIAKRYAPQIAAMYENA